MKEQFYNELKHILKENQILLNERLENHTSLHIGGEADYLVTPSTIDEIKAVTGLCVQQKVNYYVIGNGSNLLVSDEGFRGVIIKLSSNFSKVTIQEDEGTITAQAGVLLSKLANQIAKCSFTGFEFAAGIPGTFGGAVTMNAGAYDGEMKQCLVSATVMNQQGEIHQLNLEDMKLGYRTSILQQKDYILLEAEMKFRKGDQKAIFDKINELNRLRREKQPLEQYSAGSTFKRPEGYFAGKLIYDAGLSGYQIGGAAVSTKHCGFVINKENATAKEFYTLIQEIIRIVKEKFNVVLEPEVRFLGEFNKGD